MKFLATLALASLASLSLDISAAVASHFRSATMSWTPVSIKAPDTVVVKINLRLSVDRSNPNYGVFAGGCDNFADPGDIISEIQGPTHLDFGDGQRTPAALRFRVTSIGGCAPTDEDDYLIAEALNPDATLGSTNDVGILHKYIVGSDPDGVFTAYLSSFAGQGVACCRIGQFGFHCLANRSGLPYPIEVNITPLAGNSSPRTNMAGGLTVPRGVASTFQVPGYDPNGDALQWRMSTDAEAGGAGHPPNMSVNPGTGLVTWDNSLLSDACAWTTQIMVEDVDCSGTVKSKSPVDFLLYVCDGSPSAPVFFGGPTCGGTVTIPDSLPYTFALSASDADIGDVVKLAISGLPVGATMTPGLPTSGNAVSSSFSWTPTAAQKGTHILTFSASDGCNQTLCHLTIVVDDPPDISAAVACVASLSPANHKYRPVTICGVTDPDGDPVTIRVTGITQDEPTNSRGDGATCPDGQIANCNEVAVRAERSENGNGRVYVVSFTASDGVGTSEGSVSVCVPLIEGQSCVDDGQSYNSLGPCRGNKNVHPEIITDVGLSVGTVTGTQAVLEFSLPQDTQVELSVFDVAGRRLATVENGTLAAGVHQRAWDMSGETNGLYFVRLRAGAVMLTRTVAKIQ